MKTRGLTEKELNQCLTRELQQDYSLDVRTKHSHRPTHSYEKGYPGIKGVWLLKQRIARVAAVGSSAPAH